MALNLRQGLPGGRNVGPTQGLPPRQKPVPIPKPAPPIPKGPFDPPDDWYEKRNTPQLPIPKYPGPTKPAPAPPRRIPPIPMPNPPQMPVYSPGSPLAEGQRFADAIAATGTPSLPFAPGGGFSTQDVIDAIAARMGY